MATTTDTLLLMPQGVAPGATPPARVPASAWLLFAPPPAPPAPGAAVDRAVWLLVAPWPGPAPSGRTLPTALGATATPTAGRPVPAAATTTKV